ncbi:MAG: DUF1566 domain-containing protein, partial [Gammaproteobacteria bacterium]|nr:DUF1566 domain-containing protein [Gammaproteobacteria bacterium]
SDKPEFATVDLLTGAVTPIANGTAIIKAIKDADAVYSQAEAEYTVIVENTLPMISSDTEIRFDVTSEQKQFTYKPTLVSGEIVTWDFYGENLPYWVIIDPDTGVISTNSIDNSYAGLYSDLTLVATNSKGSSEIRSISIAVVPDAAPNITMQTQIVNNKLEMIHNGPSEEIIFQNTGGFAGPGNWTVGGDFPNPETGWIQMVSYSWAPETALLISPSIAHLGTHTITVTADNGNGSSSVSFTLEIRLKMPYLQVGNNRDGLSVSWSSPGESLSPVSYDLYVSDQGDVSPDTFNDATADLIAGYQPGDLITTINGNAFSTGKKYNMMLVANYAGLETRSIPLHTLVSVLPDTGAKYCNAGSGIQYTCGIQNYPQQDGDLGLDAIQEQESGNNFEFKRFDVMDATMQVTAVEEQKQCIRDRATGLLWEYLPEKMTISNTGLAERITTVNTAAKCGKTNWRLPTTNELLSILNYGAQSDGKTTFVYSYPPFRLNEQGYTNPYKRYWTGDRESIAATYSWFVDFGHGLIEQNTTANMGTVHAILVSSDTVAPLFSERLSDLEDGTVIDSYTGLMWKKCTEGYRYNVDTKTCDVNTGDVTNFSWQDALLRAQEVNSGSAGRENYEKTDWRVPNVLELNSLMRREDGEASMFETSVFPNTSNEKRYWTNTPQSSGGNNAWSVGLVETGQASLNGMMHADSITTTNPVRLVRQSGITPVIRWYLDSDGDGFATRDIYVDSYIKPEGNYKKASGNWDCNDGDNLIHPYRSEIIDDGVDNNCNGIIDEGEFSGGA